MIFRSRSKIPGWFVGLVVLVTGVLTFWAMLQRNDGQIWATEAATYPQRVTQVLAPATAVHRPGAFHQIRQGAAPMMQPVAGNRPIPPIQAGAPSPHSDRGACTLCHMVVDQVGAVIPMIPALASLPHQYRGVCINCHQVKGAATGGATAGGAGTGTAQGGSAATVAGTVPSMGSAIGAGTAFATGSGLAQGAGVAPSASYGPGGGYGQAGGVGADNAGAVGGPFNPVAALQGRPLQTAPTEGTWLGMELAPITPVIQQQYSLPPGTAGVAVAEAEAQALAAGVQPGDVIVAINGVPVSDLSALHQATGSLTLSSATVTLQRQGQVFQVALGAGAPGGTLSPPGWPAVGQAMQPLGSPGGAAAYGQGAIGAQNPYPGQGYPAVPGAQAQGGVAYPTQP